MPVLVLLLLAVFVSVPVLPAAAAEPADAERAPIGLSLLLGRRRQAGGLSFALGLRFGAF